MTMTKLLKGLYAVGVAAVLMASATTTHAADLKAEIPFRFTVNNRVLPAGVYDVSFSGGVLAVRGMTGGAFVITTPTESTTSTSARLVFHKLGDEYVMREAWAGSYGRLIPASRREPRRGDVASSSTRIEVPLS
jgi:hypothetical protein